MSTSTKAQLLIHLRCMKAALTDPILAADWLKLHALTWHINEALEPGTYDRKLAERAAAKAAESAAKEGA
jgi:hypothetical protein